MRKVRVYCLNSLIQGVGGEEKNNLKNGQKLRITTLPSFAVLLKHP